MCPKFEQLDFLGHNFPDYIPFLSYATRKSVPFCFFLCIWDTILPVLPADFLRPVAKSVPPQQFLKIRDTFTLIFTYLLRKMPIKVSQICINNTFGAKATHQKPVCRIFAYSHIADTSALACLTMMTEMLWRPSVKGYSPSNCLIPT